MLSRESRIVGSVLAAVAGDILGAPFEGFKIANPTDEQLSDPFASKWDKAVVPKARELHDLHGGWIAEPMETLGFFKRFELTDDSHHLLIVVDSIIACGGFDMDDIAARLLAWYDGGLGKGCGGVTGTALQELERGAHWLESGTRARLRADENGVVLYQGRNHESAYNVIIVPANGPLMRSGPVGILFGLDHERRDQAVEQLTRITHDFDECVEAARLHAYMTALAVEGESISDALTLAADRYPDAFAKAWAVPSSDFVHTGGAVTSLGVALHAVDRGTDIREVLMRAVATENWTGIKSYGNSIWANPDRDTYAEIAGQMAGAFHGVNDVPMKWLEGAFPRSLDDLLHTGHVFARTVRGLRADRANFLDRPLATT